MYHTVKRRITDMIKTKHDDVIKWKHFPLYWPFVRGIHRSPVNSPQKGQWRGALMYSLICVWINGWVNNREADDFRSYHAYYDVTVMTKSQNLVHNVSDVLSLGLILTTRISLYCIWCCPGISCVFLCDLFGFTGLTHWGRVTHICVDKLTIIGSDNGLSPGRRQAII